MRAWLSVAWVGAAVFLLGRRFDSSRSAAPAARVASARAAAIQQSPSFSRDIAPILYQQCAPCHHGEGPAPFSLVTYADVLDRAGLIAASTAARRMPPWLPEPGYVRYADERWLTKGEVRLIQRWAAAGAPEGDPSERPSPPEFPEGWQLGQPDLVVAFPEYQAPAHQSDIYRNLVAPVPIAEARWVNTVEIRPGEPGVVHHARLMVDTTASSRQRDARDREPGFEGMDLHGLGVRTNAAIPDGFFEGWTPGKIPVRGPEDMGWRLRPGTDLVLQVHLPPNPQPGAVRPLVGLYFARRPPTRIPALIIFNWKIIDIPPGKKDYAITDSYRLPVDVEALGVYPHAHYLATEMEAWARLPSGAVRGLLRIKHWNFNWQDAYRFAEPISLPKGSTITMHYTYDNSADNPLNPSDPPRRVTYGPKSTDEMGDLIIQVLPPSAEDLALLKRDLSWKYQTEDAAWFAGRELALGGLLAVRGAYDEAMEHFSQALANRADAAVHAAMAGVLAARGDYGPALLHAQAATQLEPRRAIVLAAMARVLAQHPDSAIRNAKEAQRLADEADRAAAGDDALTLAAVAEAYAAAGYQDRAARAAGRAMAAATRAGDVELTAALQRRLEQYGARPR